MTATEMGAGPLAGLRVVEFAGIGPGPHCAMQLADMGAEVLRIERPGGNGWPNPVVDRGRTCITLDIRTEVGRRRCLELVQRADVLIEGFRPGVMERLGLGPDDLQKLNPRLVYGRMTGWGQTGPLAQTAGHDINYIALTGALAAIGPQQGEAVPPLNLVGDFGGGSMFLTVGILAALLERERSGKGQVVDAAIVDGTASLMSFFSGLLPTGRIDMRQGHNLLGGATPWYRCYRCADGRQIAVGALEPAFYHELVQRSGAGEALQEQAMSSEGQAVQAKHWAQLFAQRSRDEWCELLEGSDACFAPVLELEEAQQHPHMAARQVYQEIDGALHSAPAPRFSRSVSQIRPSVVVDAALDIWKD
ncbi:CaiB/BaiF CoA transferase family protein [Halopseudomonas bauzanensis]|uniref:Alpha-methylacyl-CoA racemase n=1 Tax=Halopseudomonas bauzanensis TaxID=653930 RepID=A0A031MIC5_9GAMM|nr:CaiB/BaiF CoA-transferase family protein [Halopseudomonas bauzanensis]EZQ19148.1 carnitine dehydratase [Halopseudomonas bauzanensis]TKA90730.1 CoA transferase [Halopseudomonas bauzanensis]SER56272.1 alpha-methylacyl-CoA racemase [Halopseudomonas bauzanensis]SFL68600.1 alpha-methylacyl-CoA racemase [Halopseudomonas bauzanensis]